MKYFLEVFVLVVMFLAIQIVDITTEERPLYYWTESCPNVCEDIEANCNSTGVINASIIVYCHHLREVCLTACVSG